MRQLAALLILTAAVTTADAKPKPKDSVKVHMDNAAKAHKAGKFDVALTELQAAYAIDPQPKLLFAIAQVYAKLDNCESAIENYEKFNAETKDKQKQAVVKQAIDACQKKLDEKAEKEKAAKPDKGEGVFRAKKPGENELPTADTRPAETPKVETAPTPPPVETKAPEEPKPVEQKQITRFDEPPQPAPQPAVTTTVTAQPTSSPWYKDPIGDALVVTGVGAAVLSIVMYRGSQSELDDAEAAKTLAEYNDHRDTAESKQMYTIVFAGAGIALVTAGVLRYKLRSKPHESNSLAVVPNEHGGLITWSGGF